MAEVLDVKSADWSCALDRAVRLIDEGKVLAFPTDTVYGLGADPFNLAAVVEVYRIKGRAFTRPLPLLVGSLDQAIDLTSHAPGLFFSLARKYWPGPLTLVVPAARRLPLKVTGNTGNVGLRWPRAPLVESLIAAAARPLTGTSANRSGQAACGTAEEVNVQIGTYLPLILDGGPSEHNASSTVVDLTADHPRILRHGPISDDELKEFFC
jgi:L-threonylcarbamoyladenylate synthase